MNSKHLFVLLLLLSFSAQAQEFNKKVFAKVENETAKFVADTTAYKNAVSKNLLENGYTVTFNKVEIKEQLTLGTNRKFYYVLLTNKHNTVKVARWLTKDGNTYTTDDTIEEGDLAEQIYLTCVGEGDCSPQLFEDGDMRMWGCSEVVACGAVAGEEPKCKVLQSVFVIE